MAASAQDQHPFPIYNARFRFTFPILDMVSGQVVTGVSADSEASQDSGTFADCTNEATEIATASGIYYLDLIGTELDTTNTTIQVKAGAGNRTGVYPLSPRRLPVIRTGTCGAAGSATTIVLDAAASSVTDYYNGCYINITNNTPTNAIGQARKVISYDGPSRTATVATYGTNPTSGTTFEVLLGPEAVDVKSWVGKLISGRWYRWFSRRDGII